MTRLADGDRAAVPAVFRAVWPLVRRFAERALGERARADADDVAQQALLKVFSRAASFDSGRDALPWILSIVAWECRTLRTRARRRREVGEAALSALACGSVTPEEAAVERDLAAAAAAVLGELSPIDQEAVRALVAGTRPDGVAPATFRKRLERALGRLRLLWRTRHGAK